MKNKKEENKAFSKKKMNGDLNENKKVGGKKVRMAKT